MESLLSNLFPGTIFPCLTRWSCNSVDCNLQQSEMAPQTSGNSHPPAALTQLQPTSIFFSRETLCSLPHSLRITSTCVFFGICLVVCLLFVCACLHICIYNCFDTPQALRPDIGGVQRCRRVACLLLISARLSISEGANIFRYSKNQ